MDKCRITAVELNNVKSYRSARVEFADGVNVIGGVNGAGKSTIFEAIGFCLFNVKARDFIGSAGNFIREGSTTGFVNVWFYGRDGLEYKVNRDLKGARQILHYLDDTGGWFPMEDEDAPGKIMELLNLSGNTGLDKMFTDIIGPFQAEFITPFVASGKTRKDHFDKILGISRWRDLYEKTSSVKTLFNRRLENLENRMGFMENEVADLPLKERDIEEKKIALVEVSAKVEELTGKKKEVEQVVKTQEELKKRVDKLQHGETRLQSELDGKNSLMDEKMTQLQSAAKCEELVKEAEPGFLEYTRDENNRKKLEKDRKKRDTLIKMESALETKLAGKTESLKVRKIRSEEDLEKNHLETEKALEYMEQTGTLLDEAVLREKEMRSRSGERAKIREEIRLVDIDFISRKIESVETALENITGLENSIEKRTSELAGKKLVEEAAGRLDEIEAGLSRVSGEIAGNRAHLKNQKEGKKKLQAGLCPYMEEKCLNLGERDAGEFFDQKIRQLQEIIKGLEEEEEKLNLEKKESLQARDRLSSLKKVEEEARKERSEIEKIKEKIKSSINKNDLIELLASLSISTGKIADSEAGSAIKTLEDTLARFSFPEEHTGFPHALGGIRGEFDRAKAKILERAGTLLELAQKELEKAVGHRSGVEKNMKNMQREQDKLRKEALDTKAKLKIIQQEEKELEGQKNELTQVKEQLETFRGLDGEIALVGAQLEKNRPQYETYQKNLGESKKVAKLKEEILELSNAIGEIRVNLAEIRAEMEEVSKLFNGEELENARVENNRLAGELAASQSEVKHLEEKIEELKQEIKKMKQTLSEMTALKKEINRYKKSMEFAVFLREGVLNNVAERVSRALRRDVSIPASRIYRQISGGNGSEELSWGEGYSVQLTDRIGKRERTREDRQLSGGQMMTAVIALRLALLQAVGSKIAFFDEPTSNLDENRRENLAEAFRNLEQKARKEKWYNQLFLVSHDQSFHGISRNYIHLDLNDKKETELDSAFTPSIRHVRVKVEAELGK